MKTALNENHYAKVAKKIRRYNSAQLNNIKDERFENALKRKMEMLKEINDASLSERIFA